MGGGEELGKDELGKEVSTSLEPLGLGMTPPLVAYAKTCPVPEAECWAIAEETVAADEGRDTGAMIDDAGVASWLDGAGASQSMGLLSLGDGDAAAVTCRSAVPRSSSAGIVDRVWRRFGVGTRLPVAEATVCAVVVAERSIIPDGGRGTRAGGPAFALHGHTKRMQSTKLVAALSF